jgi:predicted nuclease with TOPRIM domain
MSIKLDDVLTYGKLFAIVLIIAAPFAYYMVVEYKDINEKKLLLRDEINKFEKYKSDQIQELNDKIVLLSSIDNELNHAKTLPIQEKVKITELTNKYIQCKNDFDKYKKQIIPLELEVANEEKITKLMHEFSSLGVNLSHIDWCDKEYSKRYNQAKSILSEIKTLSSKYEFDNAYLSFFYNNSSNKIALTVGKCVENKRALFLK